MRILLSLSLLLFAYISLFAQLELKEIDTDRLPDGKLYQSWEQPLIFSKTYHVSQTAKASDNNPGTEALPFKSISKAAQIAQAGERVLIHTGTYFECIRPVNEGKSPSEMIVFEGAEGEKVTITGAFSPDPKRWYRSEDWVYTRARMGEPESYEALLKANLEKNVWSIDLSHKDYGDYNPFAMTNLMLDRSWLDIARAKMDAHLKRRGMIFINGERVEQVEKPSKLRRLEQGFWCSHNGQTVHLKLPKGKSPADLEIQLVVKEFLFAPLKKGMGYIKLKNLNFVYAANGFPVPQQGMLSAHTGHHMIIENCSIDWANSLGIDLGEKMWGVMADQTKLGSHIVRNCQITNCGMAGIQGMNALNYLIENNELYNIGWQDAEHSFECGGMKFHWSNGTLIRNNYLHDLVFAPGIWLDYRCKNTRITQNAFVNIKSARGGVYVEASQFRNQVDHNLFHKFRSQYWLSGDYGAGGSALYTDGSDSLIFAYNWVSAAENTGYGCYLNAERIVGTRGGITRDHQIHHNLFATRGTYVVELPSQYHSLDQNVYLNPDRGYILMKYPEPSLRLDVAGVQRLYGFEKQGEVVQEARVREEDGRLMIRLPEGFKTEAGPFKALGEQNWLDFQRVMKNRAKGAVK